MTTYDVTSDTAVGVVQAVAALQRGDLVVLPTDTVYGVAADAFSPAAVDRLLAAKGRGRDMPVPVLVGDVRALHGLAADVTEQMQALVDAHWPGPLTIIVPAAPSLVWDLGETRGTVAVRMPQHPVALDVLSSTGPLAVSSANRTGHPPPATADEAERQLGAAVSVYLEAGSSGDAVASTIVDLTGERPVVRRAGALPVEVLRDVLPELDAPS
jgi:tRNA threonylcarbamoyl adenosine modification protein (Sua5/YciO/YrdC/YwlC family)